MDKSFQKLQASFEQGAAHILMILVLLSGIVLGVYLVQQRTHFLPKAFLSNPITPIPTPTLTPTPAPFDTISPSVSITSPSNGSSFRAGTAVNITATATDNIGVSKVLFLVNGGVICTDTATPYSCQFTIPSKKLQATSQATKKPSYQIQAKAYDKAGNMGASSIVTVSSK